MKMTRSLVVKIVGLSFGFIASAAFAEKVEVKITVPPALSYTMKVDDVTGNAVLMNDGRVTAENVHIKLENLETGLSLRNTHTKERLETTKYPEAILVKAEGKDGKGKGVIKLKGIEKPVEGTYTIEKDTLIAVFPMKISDYEIKDLRYMGVSPKDLVEVTVRLPVKKEDAKAAPVVTSAASPAKK